MSLLDQVIKHNFDTVKSNPDGTGTYLTVDKKREDGTIFESSVLSNKISGKYTTRTVTIFDTNGVTPLKVTVFTITYDSMGGILSEVVT